MEHQHHNEITKLHICLLNNGNKYYFDYCLNTQCICEHWSEQEMISFDATSTTTINLQHSLCNILGIHYLANIYVIL
jgi:hypothetical protein